jgi:hypothetical protein
MSSCFRFAAARSLGPGGLVSGAAWMRSSHSISAMVRSASIRQNIYHKWWPRQTNRGRRCDGGNPARRATGQVLATDSGDQPCSGLLRRGFSGSRTDGQTRKVVLQAPSALAAARFATQSSAWDIWRRVSLIWTTPDCFSLHSKSIRYIHVAASATQLISHPPHMASVRMKFGSPASVDRRISNFVADAFDSWWASRPEIIRQTIETILRRSYIT